MIRQSLELFRPGHLPRYGDETGFEKGKKYIFQKKESASEPRSNTRALRKFDHLGQALTWARSSLGADCYLIVST